MKKLVLLALLAIPAISVADCYCTCIDGRNQPICQNALDVKPVCPPRVCPIEPPSVKPINPPTVPPIGTRRCYQKYVWDHNYQKYMWKQVCS